MMGGHQVPEQGPNDDGYDEDGYDESQRAEILEATRDGPSDGNILTDLTPDLGDEPLDDDTDDLEMLADETGEEDEDLLQDEDDMEEDSLQEDFDNEVEALDEELDDGDDIALKP